MSGSATASTPRLRWRSALSRRAPLHGAWWPESDDPLQELPGLILEIDDRRGAPVPCLILGVTNWQSRPPRLRVAGRQVRIGWFTTQADWLLTASWEDRYNLQLLIVPPDMDVAVADAAMTLAARAECRVPPADIFDTARAHVAAATPVHSNSTGT
jgi:Family of unknown function (DUF5994)